MSWKDLIQTIYYLAGTVAAIGTLSAAFIALRVYKRNSWLERARWASELNKSFYSEGRLKSVRDRLDCEVGSDDVDRLVSEENAEFTDYLNFFEYLAFLKKANQLDESDIHYLFDYYLRCLNRHDKVRAYILNSDNGYEGLAGLIESARAKNRLSDSSQAGPHSPPEIGKSE